MNSVLYLRLLTQERYLVAEKIFEKIDIFEQRSQLGGLWNFSPTAWKGTTEIPHISPDQPLDEAEWKEVSDQGDDCDPPILYSPMYEELETNIPHFLMQFSDSPCFTQHQLFPSREETMQYLKEYANDVKYLIKFHTQVTKVLQRNGENASWSVCYKDLVLNRAAQGIYDAIVVATGHHSVPYIPDIPGIREWNQRYPGTVSHSKFYQQRQDFSDKKVLIVGYAASGQDIAAQISKCSQIPLIVSQRSSSRAIQDTVSTKFLPEIVEFLLLSTQERAVRFRNGHIESNLDAIIFCTGYLYSYPFLSAIQPPFIGTGERVQHLYQHIFSIDHPSLAFVGLPKPIIPFPTCEAQAAAIARVWSGRIELPSESIMREWEKAVLLEQGGGKKFHDLSFPKDAKYRNALIDWSLQAKNNHHGKLPRKWNKEEMWIRERCPVIKRAFMEKGEERHRIRKMDELDFPDYDIWVQEQNRN